MVTSHCCWFGFFYIVEILKKEKIFQQEGESVLSPQWRTADPNAMFALKREKEDKCAGTVKQALTL